MSVALKRPMYRPGHPDGPTVGFDVVVAKFGLGRIPGSPLPHPAAGYTRTFGKQMAETVEWVQRKNGLAATGNIGQATWDIIWPHLDDYRRWKYRRWEVPKTAEQLAWEELLGWMVEMSTKTPGYLLGGGHGIPLEDVSAYQRTDCSSSCSKVLFEAGLFEGREFAIVSEMFEGWGSPGAGTYFTVYYNVEHVFIRLHKSQWWRFDTSPHGDGGRGPQLRMLPRFTSGFGVRHYPGM